MGHTSHHDASGGDEHHGGTGVYIRVFLALCVLTGASFFTYTDVWRERIPTEVGWAFMMAVSCTKAMLVISFFMHLKWEANWKYVLTIPATIMSIFLVMMLVPDVGRRIERYSPNRLDHMTIEKPAADHAGETAGGGEGH